MAPGSCSFDVYDGIVVVDDFVIRDFECGVARCPACTLNGLTSASYASVTSDIEGAAHLHSKNLSKADVYAIG